MSTLATSSAGRDGQRRTAPLPWVLLTLTDLLAIATLARCFTGAGELALALPVCGLVHVLAGGGRRLGARLARRPEGAPGRALAFSSAGWLLALVVAFVLPLAGLEWHTFTDGLPLGRTWRVADGQLSVAWSIFSNKIAPVVEASGLVLVTGWAAGAMALASEVLYADAGLPAILALVPAFDVVVFTGTLGTSTGRAVELAAIAASALGFLVTAQADRRGGRTVVVARAAGAPARAARNLPQSGATRGAARRLAIPGVTLAAAIAAGVIGPAIPGATSAPLIAWHGIAAGRHGTGPGGSGGGAPNKTIVSDLVQVAEQEVQNSGALLFTVHSSLRLRETLVTLDKFNGNAWSAVTGSGHGTSSVPQFTTSLSSLDRDPPPAFELPNGSQVVEQSIEISSLGGQWLPTPGVTSAIDGVSGISRLGANGPLASLAPLSANFTYGVKATIPPTSAPLLEAADIVAADTTIGTPAVDLELPRPVPAPIERLAHSIVAGVANPYQMAVKIQDYFLSGHGFTYKLPTFQPGGAIADTSQTYRALEAFLFGSRTGYCQQFATAFAVLARVEGLPTRIAVGFLPGKQVKKNEYIVTGAQVHAWPEVFIPPYGWVTFEPTPGASIPTKHGETTTTIAAQRHLGGTTGTTLPHGIRSNFRLIGGRGGPAGKHGTTHLTAPARAAQSGSSGAADLLFALLLFALAWLVGVPTWRVLRRRRDRRDPRRSTVEAWRSATWLLAAAGAHRRRAETHLEFVDRVRRLGVLTRDADDALERLARRMDRALYGPPAAGGAAAPDALAAWADSAAIRRSARRRIAWWQQLTLLVDPRALVSSP